ncbi:PLP-dependent aminotransferase family protein [Glutamicibacter mishrai]|uniref:PLP-dependent aminotransferase family protein n=1 Tax=Glutamicibacter mishrai TaxID=1775880 RepID=A0A6H0SIQ3_9MICC|nr:PLP-dependent aminotransferase family protein [Glutamicibacter mishrai]QIV87194.1 PLP-dependent aminotransferase family protein [Glutamicibacter mishrai]
MGRVTGAALAGMLGAADTSQPAYRWLFETLRSLIANGRILHGSVLPSEREVVARLGLSRTTISRAYAELRDSGYASSRQGSGTVAQIPGGPVAGGAEPLPLGGFGPMPGSTALDLTCAAPNAPTGMLGEFQAALEQLPRYAATMGYYPLGLEPLRLALADYYTRKGLPTGPDQIIVTSGALSSVAAAGRAVMGRGQSVLAESPTYPNSLLALKAHGARTAAVPIGPDGSDMEQIASALHTVSPTVMLCLPDFHNPVGTLLDDARRERWAAELDRAGTVGIIDETCAELWLDTEPDVLPMAAFSKNLVTVGSASKSHWGGLRLGWIRTPRHLSGAIARSRMSMDLGAPVLEQLVLANLLNAGTSLAQSAREGLRDNRDWMIAELQRLLPEWKPNRPAGGLSLWCQLPQPRSSALARQLKSVLLAPGSTFAVEGHGLEHYLRLPFAQDRADLEQALPAIAEAWHKVAA